MINFTTNTAMLMILRCFLFCWQGSKTVHCRTWLRTYDSYLNTVSDGVLDTTFVNSTVERINLRDMRDFMAISSNITLIEHLDWKGYSGLIRNSSVGTIFSMVCNDNLTMNNVHIHEISMNGFSFSGQKFLANSTTIEAVQPMGMRFDSGAAEFHNCHFGNVKNHGIQIIGNAVVRMSNVTISGCKNRCFDMDFKGQLHLINVTVAGILIDSESNVILYRGEDSAAASKNDSIETAVECRREMANALVCDYSNRSDVSMTNGYLFLDSCINLVLMLFITVSII